MFEAAIKNLQQKKSLIELHGTRFKLLPKPTSLGILSPIPKALIKSAKNKNYQNFFDFGKIGQQLLEYKHTLTLGHIFKIIPNLK